MYRIIQKQLVPVAHWSIITIDSTCRFPEADRIRGRERGRQNIARLFLRSEKCSFQHNKDADSFWFGKTKRRWGHELDNGEVHDAVGWNLRIFIHRTCVFSSIFFNSFSSCMGVLFERQFDDWKLDWKWICFWSWQHRYTIGNVFLPIDTELKKGTSNLVRDWYNDKRNVSVEWHSI